MAGYPHGREDATAAAMADTHAEGKKTQLQLLWQETHAGGKT